MKYSILFFCAVLLQASGCVTQNTAVIEPITQPVEKHISAKIIPTEESSMAVAKETQRLIHAGIIQGNIMETFPHQISVRGPVSVIRRLQQMAGEK